MNEAKFKILIENFSPALLAETFQKSHDFFRIKQDLILTNKNDKITDIVQLGDFVLEDNTNILVVSAKALSPLSERSGRKNQYDIAKKILKDNPRYNAGIFVYYDNRGDFRMSLIYAEYLGTKVDYSTFRRFTYFISREQKNITFIQQVSPFNFLNLTQLKELFSVEKVTKEFFKKYHDLFIDTLEDFEKNEVFQNTVVKTNISTSPDFVKKMMGQIVFLYFVQKKGWLGVRPNENWGSGDQAFLRKLFTVCEKSNKNYFNDYLEPLFYKALAEKRGDDDFFQELNCRIPFLNGGLFESIYDWQNTTIYIPNKTIGNLLDFFDQYNFTVDENTPSDQEISVDPEMLGKIFENLLEVKDRKDKGAFYTPREIVHYMCRESLIQHLISENTAPEERIRKIFEIKDTDLSVLIDGDKKTENIKKMQELKDIADKVDISLRNVKIVDPAVGSGAFPMGMLNEISSVRFYLNSNFLHKLNIGEKELSLYDIKKETLENCIYAVDIEPGAVEIAKLRFWLALVVEYESNDSNIAPPTLPNLDYKIMQGNSLLEEYEGVKLFDEKIVKTIDTDKEKQIDEIKEKQILIQKEYLNLNQKNKLTLFKKAELDIEAKKLNERLKKLTQVDKNNIEKLGLFDLNKHKESKLKADELKYLQKQFFETNKKDKKDGIKKQIEKLEWELIEATLKEEGKISELSKIEEFKKSKVKPFFLWKLHFADVFEQKGGFDIVIGNPPYIKEYTDKKAFNGLKKSVYYQGKMDLWYMFSCMGINLLKKEGVECFIAQNNWVTSSGASKMRNVIIRDSQIISLIDFRDYKIFDTAGIQTMIMIFKKTKYLNKYNFDLRTIVSKKPTFEDIISILNKTESNNVQYLQPEIIRDIFLDKKLIFSNSEINSVLELISKNSNFYLKEKEVAQGIVYPQDYLNKKNQIILGKNYKVGDGIFVLSDDEKKRIGFTEKDLQLIKPSYTTKELHKWYGDSVNREWTIYTDSSFKNIKKINDYQIIKKHLDKFTKIITSDNKPFGLHRAREEFFFKGEKIIVARKCSSPAFSYVTFDSYVSATFYVIKTKRINQKYLTGILNSKLISFWLKNKGKMQGGNYQIDKEPILEIPIFVTKKINQEKLISIVDQILDVTKNQDYIQNTEKQSEVEKLENQIDKLVYEFYNLTSKEIIIVENSTKK